MANEATHEVGDIVSAETLKKLNKSELATLARGLYGLNVSPDQNSADEMRDLIMNAARKFKGNAEMRVVQKGDKGDVPPGYVKIKVSPGQYNPNERPIPVGLNFRMATIPVNKEVIMPGKWMPCLEDAVERRYAVRKLPDGREELGASDQHKYPFTLLVDNR